MGLFGKRKKENTAEAEYMSKIDVAKCLQEDCTLIVDDIFTIIGVGTVVTGKIETGMCRIGETAMVGSYETTITKIDIQTKERKPNGAAYASEHVGLGLRGLSKEQIKIGDIVKIKNGNQYHM